jgi:hypothetical protein
VIFETVHRYQWWAIGLAVLGVGTYITLHVRHVRRRRARVAAAVAAAEAEPPAP